MDIKVPLGLWVCVLVAGMAVGDAGFGHCEPKSLEATCLVNSADLTWEAPEGGNLSGYNVYLRAEGESVFAKANLELVSATLYTVSSLTTGISYDFGVTAFYSDGQESAMSAPASCITG